MALRPWQRFEHYDAVAVRPGLAGKPANSADGIGRRLRLVHEPLVALLAEHGVPALVVDSFCPRGVRESMNRRA
jgi:hypothetical protein